jgi:arylsulfatase A-like enzyme
LLEVLWREDNGTERDLLLWPAPGESWKGWFEFRFPLDKSGRGEMVARKPSGSSANDSIALVAPRLERRGIRIGNHTPIPHIVLVVFDTFRWDHVFRYGSVHTETPNIDHFLANSIEFRNAYTRTTFTQPSHTSMFTGLPPRSHGIWKNGQVLSPTIDTVPQLLYKAGYRTGAFFEISTLRDPSGFSTGFDSYEFCLKYDEKTVDRVREWLQTVRNQRYFLFVNLATVHTPRSLPHGVWQLTCSMGSSARYHLKADRRRETMRVVLPPGTSQLRFEAQRRCSRPVHLDTTPLRMAIWNLTIKPHDLVSLSWGSDVQRPERLNYLVSPPEWTENDIVFEGTTTARMTNSSADTIVALVRFDAYPDFSDDVEQDRIQYSMATLALDVLFGELLEVINGLSDPDHTAIILVGDHGEGLETHRDRIHGHEVYEEATHVPLAIRIPGTKPQVRDALAPLESLAPTILQMASIPPIKDMIDLTLGGDLRNLPSSLVSEAFVMRTPSGEFPDPTDQSIRTSEWSLVFDSVRRDTFLFHRKSDPSESVNLAAEFPSVVDSLSSLLDEMISRQESIHEPGVISDDPSLKEALRALGYVE